jgi:hypothetical protein
MTVVRRALNVFHTLPRRTSLAAVAVAVAAVPIGIAASGASSAPLAPETPVVDPDYLYSQLYGMATSYSYRISGADGDPRNPADPFNVPPTVNGWQELYAHWRHELTQGAPLTRFATARDHYFRRSGGYRFDSDDAEVTIPGAACPGQRVLLAAHPDEVPVSNDIASLIDSGTTSAITGFGAARRRLTLSNLGNEGAYDGLSGVAVTLSEYKALVDWYSANHTYPKRTLKVALLDASKKGREGSKYYAGNLIPAGPQGQYVLFANMDALGLDYPAYHLGTEFYWNNLTGGGVPPWFTFIKATPTAPNAAYPDTGAGSPGASIAANAAAIGRFRGDLQAAVRAGFAQQGAKYAFSVPLENPLRYDESGGNTGGKTGIVPTKPAYSEADQAAYSPVRDDTDALEDEQAFFNQGIPGFTVGGVKDSTPDENPYASAVNAGTKATPIVAYAGNGTTFQLGNGTPQAQGVALSTLSAAAAAGATNIKVASNAELAVGSVIAIDAGSNTEVRTITAIGTTGANGTGDTITPPLTLAHGSGTSFALPDTALTSAAAAGDGTIDVGSAAHLRIGEKVMIDPGPNAEVAAIASAGPGGVHLVARLTRDHPSGSAVSVLEGQPAWYTGDSIEHLNFLTSGAPHAVGGPSQPSEELKRGLELPAQWTSLLLADDDYLGATAQPTRPVAYFETDPVKPDTLTVKFDAGFSRDKDGGGEGLSYFWDFGDGTGGVGVSPTHTYSGPINADVRLVVLKGADAGVYRQAVAVGATGGAPPATNACGTLTDEEAAVVMTRARQATDAKEVTR